jgi:hypothetical protein
MKDRELLIKFTTHITKETEMWRIPIEDFVVDEFLEANKKTLRHSVSDLKEMLISWENYKGNVLDINDADLNYFIDREYKSESLLKRYMMHVGSCEGITFVSELEQSCSGVEFTKEEINYLKNLDKEIE